MIFRSEVQMNCESKRKFYQYVDQEVLGSSADDGQSSSLSGEKVETCRNLDEVSQIKKRVAHLEEETQLMMQEMSKNTAERKTLMKDVYRQLKLIQFSSYHEKQTYKFYKQQEGGRSDGLCQVLYEDLNPSVVVRGSSGAHSVTTPGHVERRISNILCIGYND